MITETYIVSEETASEEFGSGDWYVVHTYAGYENKVKSNLESRIASMNMEDRIFECVIPMEDVIEFKNGKKVVVIVKIQIPAGAATPAPPVGTALGPHGVNIMDFCKMYNAQTEGQRGTIIPVEITIFEDRSFTFITKTPPTAVLLRDAAGLEKGAQTTGREQVGTITEKQL